MNSKIQKYRKSHPKCKYCEYLKMESGKGIVPSFYKCIAKDKIIVYESIPKYFCSCYEVKDYEI